MQDIRHVKGCDASNVWKGLAAGLVGGLVASWTMNRFQDAWSGFTKGIEIWSRNEFQDVWSEFADGDEGSTGKRGSQTDSQAEVQDDTTVRAASAVSEGLFGHKLTPNQKKVGGTAVHYVLGTGVGGLYGATAEIVPHVTEGLGL